MGKIINRLVIIAAVVSIISFVCLFFHAYNVFFPIENEANLTVTTQMGDELYYTRAVPSLFHLAFGSKVEYVFTGINGNTASNTIVMQWGEYPWMKVLFFVQIAIMVASIAAFVICRDFEGVNTKRKVVLGLSSGMIAVSIFAIVIALLTFKLCGITDETGRETLINAYSQVPAVGDLESITGIETQVGAGPIAYASVQGVIVLLHASVIALHFVERHRKNKAVAA